MVDVQSGLVSFTDLAGASLSEVQETLLSLPVRDTSTTVYLVTPPFALQTLDRRFSGCFVADKPVFPHLDLDHIPEAVEMGWREGLSLGIYIGELDCLKQSVNHLS